MKQCHVLGLVKLQFKSLIKASGHYSVQGVTMHYQKGEVMLAVVRTYHFRK